MNPVNKAFLKLALLPSGLYQRMGINSAQLKTILHIKLTMDDRRAGTLYQAQAKKRKKPVSMATVGTMVMSAILGLMYLLSFMAGENAITHLTFYFSFFFFMLSATLISDFTSVLIDIRDNYIILPKPVNDRTFLAARLLHIFIHICKVVLPMALPGLIYMYIAYGIGGSLLFLPHVLFVTLFAIFFINALYILILKFTTPQRFQSIISYIQIIFAIVVYASYQVVPRMIRDMGLEKFDISDKTGILYYPIYWLACLWNVLYTHSFTTIQLLAAIAGLLLPFMSIYLVLKYLAPSFNNKLALINASTTNFGNSTSTKAVKTRSSYADFLGKLFTRGNAERMGFLFTWKMTSRSRDFKLKVYPAIGYLVVYVVIMFMNSKGLSLQEIAEQGRAGKVIVISGLYFTSLLLTMAIGQITYSDKYKASWIYYTSPLQRPGEVITGAAKAAIFKFYIPMVVFITIAGIIIIGPKILPNIALGMFNVLLIATLLVYIGNKTFPFSLQQNNNVKGGTFIRNLFVFFISGLIAVGHYILYDIIPAILLCTALSALATWLLMGSIKNSAWATIKSTYKED